MALSHSFPRRRGTAFNVITLSAAVSSTQCDVTEDGGGATAAYPTASSSLSNANK
jgi:hypothetical protein